MLRSLHVVIKDYLAQGYIKVDMQLLSLTRLYTPWDLASSTLSLRVCTCTWLYKKLEILMISSKITGTWARYLAGWVFSIGQRSTL